MDPSKERKGEKDSNEGGKGKSCSSRTVRSNCSLMAVKAKLTDKCLWSACKAMTAGILFILVGAGMATLGFYSDHLSTVEQTRGNTTVWVKNEAKDSHLGSLTYLGPVVMGIGGFIIVAACVMTFEARDTAAKIVPIWFRRTRIHVVSGGSGSTPSDRSSKASWERFLSQQRTSEDSADTRSAVTQALVNFSKYLQNNMDTNKLPQHNPYISNQQVPGMRKCPSEPNLVKVLRDANGNNLPESAKLLEASTPQPSQNMTYGEGLKATSRPSKPQLLSVAPDTYRQTVSMDCPRMNRSNEDGKEQTMAETINNPAPQKSDGIPVQALCFQTSCATSSSGSMSVDLYLPQGAVTLKIHDDMKENKKSPIRLVCSQESRSYKLSMQSDVHSFADDDVFANELDDNVFINQDSSFSTPQIVLGTLDSETDRKSQSSVSDNPLLPPLSDASKTSTTEEWPNYHPTALTHAANQSGDNPLLPPTPNASQPSTEEWLNYPTAFTHVENKSDSLDIQSTTDRSPQSLSLSTQFSFECLNKDSAETSATSIISKNPSSHITDQRSLSQTDTSFMNVSSLGSMESSQDIVSPVGFSGNLQYFDYNTESFSMNPACLQKIPNEQTNKMEKNLSLPEYNRESKLHTYVESGHKTNPQKHKSLESTESRLSHSKQRSPCSPKTRQFSFEGSEKMVHDPFLHPSSHYLTPSAVSGCSSSPTVLSFSPRKTRSESLPESRQAPSLKRFPLMRQVALDAFAEESGSTHRLDRSQTHISPKEAFPPDV